MAGGRRRKEEEAHCIFGRDGDGGLGQPVLGPQQPAHCAHSSVRPPPASVCSDLFQRNTIIFIDEIESKDSPFGS